MCVIIVQWSLTVTNPRNIYANLQAEPQIIAESQTRESTT